MKIKLRIILVLIMMISIVVSFTTLSNAYSINIKLSADKNLTAGDEISVTVGIKDLSVGKGIDAFMGTINYDNNVFETLTPDSLSRLNGWNTPTFNPKTNIFTVLRNSKVSNESDILVIKLKVKSNFSVANTDIKLTNISASGGATIDGGTGDININDESITLIKSSSTSTNIKTTSVGTSNQKSSSSSSATTTEQTDGTQNIVNGVSSNLENNINSNVENNIANIINGNELNENLILNDLLADTNNTANSEKEKLNNNKNIVIVILVLVMIASGIAGYKVYKIKVKKNNSKID